MKIKTHLSKGGGDKKRAQFTKSEENLAMVLDIHIVVLKNLCHVSMLLLRSSQYKGSSILFAEYWSPKVVA